MAPFQIAGKRFFLTFPKCSCEPEAAKAAMMSLMGARYLGSIVAKELHADGDPHLHVYLELKSRFCTKNPAFFDAVTGTHGNYQACRSVDAVKQYVCKDGNVIVDNVAMPEDKKVLNYGNVVAKTAEFSRKRARSETFEQTFVLMCNEGWVPCPSVGRHSKSTVGALFDLRVTGRCNASTFNNIFLKD